MFVCQSVGDGCCLIRIVQSVSFLYIQCQTRGFFLKDFACDEFFTDEDGSKEFFKDVALVTGAQQGLLSINVKRSDKPWQEFGSQFEEYYMNNSADYTGKLEVCIYAI